MNMSIVTLSKWGNSVGIRIPANIMAQAALAPGDELSISSDSNGALALIPLKKQQTGWLEQFNAIADSDSLDVDIDIANSFDEDEWTW
jgi:antitoxin component of MazEF toxin-antitoxin module